MQARRVSFEHAFLAGLIGADQEQSREMFRELTVGIAANHSRRMTQLGLAG
jgi:hypothetical protein